MAVCCPSPGCVHCWGVHPTRHAVQVSSRPCPAVQCPAIWLPRPDAAVQPTRVHPSGVQPCGVHLSARSQPSRPASAGWWRLGETSGRRGSGLDWIESSSMWSGPVPAAARSTARGGMDVGTLRRSCAGRRGSVDRGPGSVVLRREAAPDRPGRPDRRQQGRGAGRPPSPNVAGPREVRPRVASRFVVSLALRPAGRSVTAGSESSVLRFQREEHRDDRCGQDERGRAGRQGAG